VIEGEDLALFERSLRAATEQHTGAALDAAVAELGWDEALSFDPRAAVSLLFALQGGAGVTSAALDRVLASALGRELGEGTSVLLPPVGHTAAPARVDGREAAVHGLVTGGRPGMLVVAADGEQHVAAVVESKALVTRLVHGIDPELGLVEVRGAVTLTDPTPVDWGAARRLGQLALAHELVGVSRRALALAREHALERIQFDRPIAMFQAVRHRLAEALVAIETAEAMLDAAWLEGDARTASMAKATAGRSARTVAKHAQQVLAGIGFTTEHDLHRFVRRIFVLDQLLGSQAVLTKDLGHELLATRTLPRPLPL
jgi:hypothetical protein